MELSDPSRQPNSVRYQVGVIPLAWITVPWVTATLRQRNFMLRIAFEGSSTCSICRQLMLILVCPIVLELPYLVPGDSSCSSDTINALVLVLASRPT